MSLQIGLGWNTVKVEPDGADGYDIIGDIHGCADALQLLLLDLGYRQKNGAFRHPFRKAVFLGDLIDRGPHIRDVLHIVRAMVETNSAYLTLGNHEYNAICYETRAPEDAKYKYLRPHFPRHKSHLVATLAQFSDHREEWLDMVEWLKTRPICLEFEHFRAVHACWDQVEINKLRERNVNCNLADEEFLFASTLKENPEYRMVERLLKGTEIKIILSHANETHPIVSCDGHNQMSVLPGDKIYIRKKAHKLQLLHPMQHNFYESCRSKLGWGGTP